MDVGDRTGGKAPDILVVEDNRQNFELVEFLLSDAGMSVRWARDAAELRQQVADRLPDLVLMDIQLPGVDGLALVEELRGNPAACDLTILAITAHALRGDREKFLRRGCDGYLAKPIDVSSFVDQVGAFL